MPWLVMLSVANRVFLVVVATPTKRDLIFIENAEPYFGFSDLVARLAQCPRRCDFGQGDRTSDSPVRDLLLLLRWVFRFLASL